MKPAHSGQHNISLDTVIGDLGALLGLELRAETVLVAPRGKSWHLPSMEQVMDLAIGRTRQYRDRIDPERARALHAVLDLADPFPAAGDGLPSFWHHVYFWDCVPGSGLGPDGHPATGTFIPDLGFPHRMWAGGRITFFAPVVIGEKAEKRSVIRDIRMKSGRSGRFAIVTLDHEITQGGQKCLIESQDLIYRSGRMQNLPKTSRRIAPAGETRSRRHCFSPTLLFRYSAVTFNGHRIHYDREFARSDGGYSGLVVHGPLLAQLLIRLAEDSIGPLGRFRFRATAPLFDHEQAEACLRPGNGVDKGEAQLWIRGPDDRLCMEATAVAAHGMSGSAG
ncbi:MAG: acyl dehydratase [Paracoccaceae bacterium]|nr:acyl dehydratase [Paracoccaceae bacterium]